MEARHPKRGAERHRRFQSRQRARRRWVPQSSPPARSAAPDPPLQLLPPAPLLARPVQAGGGGHHPEDGQGRLQPPEVVQAHLAAQHPQQGHGGHDGHAHRSHRREEPHPTGHPLRRPQVLIHRARDPPDPGESPCSMEDGRPHGRQSPPAGHLRRIRQHQPRAPAPHPAEAGLPPRPRWVARELHPQLFRPHPHPRRHHASVRHQYRHPARVPAVADPLAPLQPRDPQA